MNNGTPIGEVTPAPQASWVPSDLKSWSSDIHGYGWGYVPSNYVCIWGSFGCGKYLSTTESTFQCWYRTEKTAPWKSHGDVLCMACAAAFHLHPDSVHTEAGGDVGKISTCYGCEQPLCNACSTCHTKGCVFEDKKVSTASEIARFSYLRCKTQKARGYGVIANAGLNVPRPYAIIHDEKSIATVLPRMTSNLKRMFVRPCPTRPRHGFVESTPMDLSKNAEVQLADLLKKACEADEQGTAELLVVPHIDAEFNLIVTPTRVAIGPGHDGATGGHGSISIPLMGAPIPELKPELLKDAAVDISKEDPYVEVVIPKDGNQIYYTQLRAGVKIPPSVGADYIPEQVTVLEVMEASGDLLEWEKQQKQIKPGTVVVHVGGTLISHYGVHCIYNGIPVMTSRKPSVGEVLEPAGKVEDPDPSAVIAGLGAGAAMPLESKDAGDLSKGMNVRLALRFMMSTLHNAGALGGKDAFWLGAATSFMIRCGMAASHGEARHKLTGMQGYRSTVHKLSFADFFGSLSTLGAAQWMFTKLKWSGSYGGPKWADCTDSIIKLEKIARDVMNGGGVPSVKAMVTQLNEAVNKAHNGGWWMNKFIEQQTFDAASKQQMDAVVYSAVGAFKMHQAKLQEKAEEIIQKWRSLEDIKVEEGKIHIQTQDAGKDAKTNYDDKSSSGSGSGYSAPSKSSPYTAAPSQDFACTCPDCLKSAGVIVYYTMSADEPDDIKALDKQLNACVHKVVMPKDTKLPAEDGWYCANCQDGKPAEAGAFGEKCSCGGQLVWGVAGKGYYLDCTKNKCMESPTIETDEPPVVNPEDIDAAYTKLQKAVDMGKATDAKAAKTAAKAKLAGEAVEPVVVQASKDTAVAGAVEEAQANLHKAGSSAQYLHYQVKVAGNPVYFSGNVPLSKIVGKMPTSGFLKSMAGSSTNNYMPFEFMKLDGHNEWMLYNKTLKAAMLFNAKDGTAQKMTWEAADEQFTKAQTAAAVATQQGSTEVTQPQS